jgi:hypothetical protein
MGWEWVEEGDGMEMAPVCPRCSQLDQVQSAQSLYAAQSGVTDSRATTVGAVIGAGPVIAGTRTHGTHVTNLARQLVPPASPRRASLVNAGDIVLLLGGLIAIALGRDGMRPSNPASDRRLGEIVVLVGVGLLAASVLIVAVRSQRDRRRYQAYRATWPAYMYVWQTAMVCLRCYGAFFPADALPAELDPASLIPVGSFRSAVIDIGTHLALASPERYRPS